MDLEFVSLKPNSIPIGEIQTNGFPAYVFYIIYESQCTKMIVARFFVASSVVPRGIFVLLIWYGHPNIEPKFKDRRPAEKYILS